MIRINPERVPLFDQIANPTDGAVLTVNNHSDTTTSALSATQVPPRSDEVVASPNVPLKIPAFLIYTSDTHPVTATVTDAFTNRIDVTNSNGGSYRFDFSGVSTSRVYLIKNNSDLSNPHPINLTGFSSAPAVTVIEPGKMMILTVGVFGTTVSGNAATYIDIDATDQ